MKTITNCILVVVLFILVMAAGFMSGFLIGLITDTLVNWYGLITDTLANGMYALSNWMGV